MSSASSANNTLHPADPNPDRIYIAHMPIDRVSEQQAIDRITSALKRHQGGWVITPNIDHLRLFHQQPALREICQHADLILADGMPLVWASRILGRPLPERVPGSGLIYTLTAAAAQMNARVFLLGGAPGAAQTASEILLQRNPNLLIAGVYCPPMGFEHNPIEMAHIRNLLASSQPDIVYVGLGFPKQEHLINQLRADFPATWFLGIGISFSFVSGRIPRAPHWMQSLGLEWLHRLLQEPRRLFKRYLIHDLPFALLLLASMLRTRFRTSMF